MTPLRRIAVLAGDAPAARAVAGAVSSLLTAVGRWVEDVAGDADLASYDAVVLPSAAQFDANRGRYRGPVLVVDGDLLAGTVAPGFRGLFSDEPWRPAVLVGGTLAPQPRPLPLLAGRALGDAPVGLAAEREPGVGYVLPAMLGPTLRTASGFWNLAALLEHALAAVIGERRALYADPWPRGIRAARALTYDLDALETSTLPDLVRDGGPATLFCCADALDRLGAPSPRLEIAAHGDVHRPFVDPATNLARVDRMCDAFRRAGFDPRGFSPPNLTYDSALAPLFARFGYVRIGYQERALRFFPYAVADGLVAGVSFYPDFLHRYVGAEEYARLLRRFCAWAAATSVLAVPCFHPCLWSEPLRRFLEAPADDVWQATLAEVVDWWRHRTCALADVAARGAAAAPPDLSLVDTSPAARLAALRPVNGEPKLAPGLRPVSHIRIAGRAVGVIPAADAPAAPVDVRLGAAWRPVGWLPAPLRRAAGRALVRVANKNGLHAWLYGDLGVAPDIRAGALRLPLVAPDEPIMVSRPAVDELRRLGRGAARRLGFARPTSHA